LFVREKVLDYQTWIEHTATKNMLPDPLTKDLAIGVFQNHITHMGVVKSFMYWVSMSLRFYLYIIMVFMRCKFINNIIFITSLLAYKNV